MNSSLAMVVPAIGALVLYPGFTSEAIAAAELLPNLTPKPAQDVIVRQEGDGHTYLRFSTLTVNSGAGPMELVPDSPETKARKQKVYQKIYYDNESFRLRLAGRFVYHAAHDHFHLEGYTLYILEPLNSPGSSGRSSEKTSSCLVDSLHVNPELPGSPSSPKYTVCSKDKPQGISVGWGDLYDYTLAGQEIDITGLPDGDYNIKIQVDPYNRLAESNELDNTSNRTVHLSGGTVTVTQ
jgi:hypothetical protein